MLSIFAVAGFWFNRETIAIHLKSVFVRVPPKISQTPPPSKRSPSTVFGDAPWALSALPECFTQVSKTSGSRAFVLAHLPPGMRMVMPGTTYAAADCSLQVRGDAILVTRGTDHLRVPPPARLYSGSGQAALLRGGPGGLELRVYTAAPAANLKP